MFISRQSPERHSASLLRRKEIGAATLVKSTLMSRSRIAVLVVIAALTISARAGHAAVPEKKGPTHLNKHQLKTLKKSAHTPDEFWLLSKYYGQESEHQERTAMEYEEQADRYASRLFNPKTGFPGGFLGQCRYLASYYHHKAEQRERLATHYQDLAQAAGGRCDKSQPTKE
jgi:hypothetical protein